MSGAPQPLPAGPVLGFYGDDFTGSTDALEILAFAGLEPILVLDALRADEIPGLERCRALGLAGVSRSKSPAWMDANLPAAFAFLKARGVRLCHYKTCSTFDSSPEVGSIGKALEIGRALFADATVPVVVGVPDLGRYQAFGNLFARGGDEIYRLDRHPTMARHPVTPMCEADLTVHLARQTTGRVGLMTIVEMAGQDAPERFRAKMDAGDAALFLDVLDEASATVAGRLLWEELPDPGFVVGSSGVEFALARYWRATGLLEDAPGLPEAAPAAQVLVVSGSCSPATGAQIAHAEKSGFVALRLDGASLLDERETAAHLDELAAAALTAMESGRSVVIYSAAGPNDLAVEAFSHWLRMQGMDAAEGNERLGAALGRLAARLLSAHSCRLVVAGGDTSGWVVSELGLTSLRIGASMVRGAPLCRATGPESWADGLEIVLKGGQVGGPRFFVAAREGTSAARAARSEVIA